MFFCKAAALTIDWQLHKQYYPHPPAWKYPYRTYLLCNEKKLIFSHQRPPSLAAKGHLSIQLWSSGRTKMRTTIPITKVPSTKVNDNLITKVPSTKVNEKCPECKQAAVRYLKRNWKSAKICPMKKKWTKTSLESINIRLFNIEWNSPRIKQQFKKVLE